MMNDELKDKLASFSLHRSAFIVSLKGVER
jgi:hypothetical protein